MYENAASHNWSRILTGCLLENSIKKRKRKTKGKVFWKIPFCPIGKEFCPEYNVVVFVPKLADSIFSGPRIKWKVLLKEKKIV